MVMTIEETLQIALEAHRGQKDLDGMPAVLHPLAVGLMGCNDTEIKTGFLHDVVEDTAMTFEDLRGKGVEEDVLAALQLLTHDDGQDYFEYVRKIAGSAEEQGDTAMAERLARINDKHRKALRLLEAAGCGTQSV